MEYKYNDLVSFLGRDVKPYWRIIGFNERNQIFITPIGSKCLLWDIDYKVVTVGRTPLFRVGKANIDYTDLPLFKELKW
ncbi:hypothetical protein D4R86_03015 [bacterium]|nr:MAG: hypothetical protein D4R86_03015 [bacterium]